MKIDFRQMSDEELVGRLLKNDHEAWTYVLTTVVMRIASQRKFSEMLSRTGHEPWEAVTALCERLYKDDFALLRTFAFRGSFDGWLYKAVHSVVAKITGLTGKKDQGREVSVDFQDPNSTVGRLEQAVSSVDVHVAVLDKRETFTRFWRENQESAFIVLMKDELGLSMDTIGALLERPANTVTQMAKRAKARLAKLENE